MRPIRMPNVTTARPWAAVTDGAWTLGEGNDVVYTRDLDNAFVAHASPIIKALRVDQNGSHPRWRLDYVSSGTDIFYLTVDNITMIPIDLDGQVLSHNIGCTDAEFETEVDDNKAYIESLVGAPVTTLSYPFHDHDEEVMRKIRLRGYVSGRSGEPSGVPGGGPNQFGGVGVAWDKSWERGTPFNWPLRDEARMVAIEAVASQADMVTWLADSTRLPIYKAANTLWPVYAINNVTTEKLLWLIDLLIADGDVWIASFKEIGDWYLARHDHIGDHIYQPKPGHSAADYGGKPWNGKSCCFSVSDDDGYTRVLTEIAPAFAARGIRFSTFINATRLSGGDHMTPAQLTTLSQTYADTVDIGNHGYNHKELISSEYAKIVNPTGVPIAVAITGTTTKTLTLYSRDPALTS